MKIIIAVLLSLLAILQFKLWFGSGSIKEVWHLDAAIAAQSRENETLRERNQSLAAEVRDLKEGLEAIEERARADLGMIREGETFYQVID
jgi:cell division protein FtsB